MNPGAFIARWRDPLKEQAQVFFAHEPRGGSGANYCDVANDFVEDQGFDGIGFNWELLDTDGAPGDPRSAQQAFVDAFSHDMALPQTEWLGLAGARACAKDFRSVFDGRGPTIVSNRLGDLWNPLTSARIEWAFVGFDETRIALLLLTTEN